jgi:hypothetical protein
VPLGGFKLDGGREIFSCYHTSWRAKENAWPHRNYLAFAHFFLCVFPFGIFYFFGDSKKITP